MAKPAIVAVDDDPQVAAAVARDLRQRYAENYRIVAANSGAEALEVLQQLKDRGDTVALLLADQRMPQMEGTGFLVRAREIVPRAKRLLLTAYADTEAAIQAINEVDLDYYLMKPWDPPDEKLYPVLDEMLDDWAANTPPPFDGIRVVGSIWSPPTHDVKDFLARNQVPYRFLDVERDEDAAAVLDAAGGKMPTVLLPDGDRLIQPDRAELAARIGMHTAAEAPFYDLIVIGGGPAGLAGAVYGSSEGLHTAMLEREAPGGQAGTSSRIENYLGFPTGISGGDLARRAVTQATRLGAEIITAVEAERVRLDDNIKIVECSDGSELRCHALLVATGMTVRKLPLEGYEKYEGAGVYYGAAPSEAASYEGGEVFIVGGANSAGQAAMMFSRHASKVTVLVRSATIEEGMSAYLIDQLHGRENVEILVNTEVIDVLGGEHVERIRLRDNASGVETEREASAVFIFVGFVPRSNVVADLVRIDDRGFIYTGKDIFRDGKPKSWNIERDPFMLETSVPGVFAAGDIRHGVIRRVASAVGQGSIAVSMIHKYLETV